MTKEFYWDLFCETGAPEVYLLYRRELRAAQRKSDRRERAEEEAERRFQLRQEKKKARHRGH